MDAVLALRVFARFKVVSCEIGFLLELSSLIIDMIC